MKGRRRQRIAEDEWTWSQIRVDHTFQCHTLKEETTMKKVKRMISTFACAVAVLIWTCAPVQAEFFGTLRSDQDWVINVDNSSSNAVSSISVNCLGKKPQNFEFTLPPGGRAQYPFAKVGKDVTRIVIYMDP